MNTGQLKRASNYIRNTLEKERRMRQSVFRYKPRQKEEKVKEIDVALRALDLLEGALGIKTIEPEQMTVF